MPEDRGLHSLVYGPKSVDKRDMLARLLHDEGIEGYAVVTKHVPGRRSADLDLHRSAPLERSNPDAVLVVDRAHEALASRSRQHAQPSSGSMDDGSADEEDERASDEGLTGSRVRCVWLTDRAKLLSERNLGAFLFHCEALPGSRADRRERVTQVISDFGLSGQLERASGQVQPARRAAGPSGGGARPPALHAQADDQADEALVAKRERVIKRAVAQSQKVLGRDRTEGLRDSVTSYSLDHLNIAGRFTPQQIIAALRKRPKGSLCFWGIPGAGKTQLAEYIAVELDLPILMRSASDLLSKWLGETEQQIAAMFAEAEAEGRCCSSTRPIRSCATARWPARSGR